MELVVPCQSLGTEWNEWNLAVLSLVVRLVLDDRDAAALRYRRIHADKRQHHRFTSSRLLAARLCKMVIVFIKVQAHGWRA